MPSSEPYDQTGISTYTIPAFKFHAGPTLPVLIAYRSFNPSSPKTVLIPTCYGGRINTTQNFTTGCLSTYHVIVVAMLANGESSSPSNTANFPQPDYRDCIRAQHTLLTDHLGITALDAVIGFSMAAQQAYYWAAMFPAFVARAIPICGSAKTSGHNWAFLEGPKAALTNSIDYEDGMYRAKGVVPKRGLKAFGRAYCAWVMSAAWYRERRWAEGTGCASVGEWMSKHWDGGWEGWDAEDLLALARMWQNGDVGSLADGEEEEGEGDYRKVLEGVKAKVLVMPCRTDQYFPPEDSATEVAHLPHGTLCVIESVWGHAAGGGSNEADAAFMDRRIGEFMGS